MAGRHPIRNDAEKALVLLREWRPRGGDGEDANRPPFYPERHSGCRPQGKAHRRPEPRVPVVASRRRRRQVVQYVWGIERDGRRGFERDAHRYEALERNTVHGTQREHLSILVDEPDGGELRAKGTAQPGEELAEQVVQAEVGKGGIRDGVEARALGRERLLHPPALGLALDGVDERRDESRGRDRFRAVDQPSGREHQGMGADAGVIEGGSGQ